MAIGQRVRAEPDAWQKRRFELKCFHSPPISPLEERVCFDGFALGAQPLCRVDLQKLRNEVLCAAVDVRLAFELELVLVSFGEEH